MLGCVSGMLTATSFIIQCLSWQAGKPKELDQSFVRVAVHSSGTRPGRG
jgi:hypothetical protein